MNEEDHAAQPQVEIKKQIIFEDEDIICLDKPANLLSIQDGYNPHLPNVASLLQKVYSKRWIVHRLDKPTSGVMVFAKNAHAHRHLSMQFQNREVKKEYHAIVVGKINWQKNIATTPLQVNGDRKHRTIPNPKHGKEARTAFEVIAKHMPFTLLAAFPQTGFRHQIRSHLASCGAAILNDDLYKPKHLDETSATIIKRLALHAYRIQVIHPRTEEWLKFTAPYPHDFKQALYKARLI